MISLHPHGERITRQNTVSVTPPMGARMVAGQIARSRILISDGNIMQLYFMEVLPVGRPMPPDPAAAAGAAAFAVGAESAATVLTGTANVAGFGCVPARWAITESLEPPKKPSITCARACARASSAVRFGL